MDFITLRVFSLLLFQLVRNYESIHWPSDRYTRHVMRYRKEWNNPAAHKSNRPLNGVRQTLVVTSAVRTAVRVDTHERAPIKISA